MANDLLNIVSASYKIISNYLLMMLSCQNPNSIFKSLTFIVFETLSCVSITFFLKFTSLGGNLA